MKKIWLAAVALMVPHLALADDAEEFIRSNILAIFYHEFGHALIDLRQLPIYGQEEDAADVASVMLMHMLYEDDAATQLVMDTADAFYAEAMAEAGELAFWDVHGASEQRYYNTICIFYGGDPDNREDMIDVMGLPEYRAASCPEEFDQAAYSWGVALEEIIIDAPGNSFVLDIKDDSAPVMSATIAAELEALNNDFGLDQPLPVIVDSCGEANAYYDPQAQSITMCTEFEPHLQALFDEL